MSIQSMIARSGQTLTHQRADESQRDPSGGRRQVWATLASAVPCWRQPASSAVRELYARRNLIVTHAIYVAQDLALRESDRIFIGSAYHTVLGVTDEGGLSKLWRIDAQEIKA